MSGTKLGIIAGAGTVPALAWEQAKQMCVAPLVIALKETDASDDLKAALVPHHTLSIGKPQSILDLLHAESVDKLLVIGKVPKQLHFEELEFDERALSILSKMQGRSDMNLFAALAEDLASEGLTLEGQSKYLGAYKVPEGVLFGSGVPSGREEEAEKALSLARSIAGLDIGQTLVVREGAVVAVEAFEHTDATIARAGNLAGPGCWVAKAARPSQDDRFDVPAVGEATVRAMGKAGASLLIVEAEKVFAFDREKCARACEETGVSIVGLK